MRAGAERAVAATKTYTAELLSLYLLFAGERAAEAAARLPEAAAETLALTTDDQLEQIAARFQYAERLVLTARGYSYATAREGALKLMETSYLSAMAFSGADLLHGPMAMIDRSVPVIAVTSPGRGGAAMQPVLEQPRRRSTRMCSGSACRTACRSPRTAWPSSSTRCSRSCRSSASPGASPLTAASIPIGPRGLSKVTQTH